jgi:fumarate reductase flavoprotein subunit
VADKSAVFNTDWLYTIELGFLLDVAESIAHSAIQRKESRGSHQRIDGFEERDDVNYLKHSLAFHNEDGAPAIQYSDVKITKSQPAKRVYGSEADKGAK